MIGSCRLVGSQSNCIKKDSFNNTNYILRGPLVNSLQSLPDLIPKFKVKIIIYDLSRYFLDANITILPKYLEFEKSNDLFSVKKPVEGWKYPDFSRIFQVVKSSLPLLISDGFFVVRVNGTIKHHVKILLDRLIGKSYFLNEVLLDSQYSIKHTDENNVTERSEYFLIYSKSKNPVIQSVYNEKTSGGYWHSFVSKGQGGPKEFRFEGKSITLSPPPGNHWKLKQESILKMCDEGKIRLNTKGSPEYWVPLKKGQIVDTNWFDLIPSSTYDLRSPSCSILAYTRLFQIFIKSKGKILHISPQSINILKHTSSQELNWICLQENLPKLTDFFTKLSEQGLHCELIDLKKEESKFIDLYDLNNGLEWDLSEKSCNNEKFTISSKFVYPTKGITRSSEKIDWKNQIVLGDCLYVLQYLHNPLKSKIKLIYIDPPFFTGNDETMIIPMGNPEGFETEGKPEIYPPIEILAYQNALSREREIKKFNEWFSDRIRLMKPLLRADGFIFVRFDYHFGHYAKIILDKVFGADNFLIEFIIRRMKKNLSEKQINQQNHLIVHSDSLFVYRASLQSKLDLSKVRKVKRKNQDIAEIEYIDDNIWLDIAGYQKVKRTNYPSENAESLLKRVIEISTEEGDIVADFFVGSGTTLAIAEKLKRKWIGVDVSTQAVNEIRKRILKFQTFESFSVIISQKETAMDGMNAKSNIKINIDGLKVTVTINNYVLPSIKPEYKSIPYLGLIDYWEIDWNHSGKNGNSFMINWYSYREIKEKIVRNFVSKSVSHTYQRKGKYKVVVNIIDILGNFFQEKHVIKLE